MVVKLLKIAMIVTKNRNINQNALKQSLTPKPVHSTLMHVYKNAVALWHYLAT